MRTYQCDVTQTCISSGQHPTHVPPSSVELGQLFQHYLRVVALTVNPTLLLIIFLRQSCFIPYIQYIIPSEN